MMDSTFVPSWQRPLTIAESRQQLEAQQLWAAEAFITADIESLLVARSEFIDSLLHTLWQQCQFPDQGLALIAVGGFGRGTLHPGSDIDLLFVHQHPLPNAIKEKIATFIQFLWDVRLDVGHSVRTLADCREQAEAEVTVATSLLEQRYISGDAELAIALQQDTFHQFPWSSRAFYQAKQDEQQQRHQQFHGTSYNLEPNIKSSPGGLRDIQTIGWIAKRHFQTQSEESLVQFGFITAAELLELREQQRFLWRIRFALHLEAGKKEDRLLFDFQVGVAQRMGYGNTGKTAVEALMKDYFNAVAAVRELNAMLLQFFDQAILGADQSTATRNLDANFFSYNNCIAARHDRVFDRDEAFLQLFLHIARDDAIETIQAHTIRLLRSARQRLQQPLCSQPQCRQLFLELLTLPKGCGLAFQLLHEHRILAHYLPQWAQIVGQMQFDLFHAYTVDEHTFRLVRNLYRYTLPDKAEDFPLCSQLVTAMDHPEWLYIAGIFHDIAKGRGGDHSELGEQDVRHFAELHGLPEHATELVAWLVRQHLFMSVTAQKRDIHDPEVVREFAETVQTQERLNYLYCLTVADIRATNSTLWNNWKATLLENLYHATAAYFARAAQTDTPSAAREMRQRIHEHQAHAMALLLSAGYDATTIELLWGRFTADYFLRHRPEQIAWHTQYIARVESDEQLPLILVGDESNQGTTELFVYHHEQDYLFAAIAAVLEGQNLSIHDAQILATRDGYVMDTFVMLQQNGQPLTDARHIESLKQQLHDVLRSRQPVPSVQRRLPRRLRSFTVTTKIEFVPTKNKHRTAFELVALDRPGLVARVARVLQRLDLNILTAKISTVGEQAEDLFIVTTRRHEALDAEQQNELRQQIIAALEDA
ncbi:[protein-PII] uridylyltransferase [Pseudidiomarina aestuarii]|uniref:[protein-PII] uridylyltransferase n=1 Tax=Pseudidiomarina aestuarii TaxID=624146 RepID=UPI003A97E44E